MSEASNVYYSGREISLHTPSGSAMLVRVEEVFLPFTQSQVMRVRILDGPPGYVSNSLVLKLYDRRFVKTRDSKHENFPWSIDTEIAAQSLWIEGQASPGLVESQYKNLNEMDLESDGWTPALREEYFWQLVQLTFTAETRAYNLLRDYQGKTLPQYFGEVCLRAPDNLVPHNLPQAQVQGILLEDIKGTFLEAIKEWDLPKRPPTFSAIGRSLIHLAASLSNHGIFHGDIRSGNIMLTTDLSRGVLIDFGNARFRDEFPSDESWTEWVGYEDEVGAVAYILDLRRIRDLPPICRTLPRVSPGLHNAMVRKKPKSWQDRWYEPDHSDEVLRPLKPGVQEWYDALPRGWYPDPEYWLQQRPYSPI